MPGFDTSALQVISNSANLKMVNGEPLEAAITRDARHRNIVNTLDFAVTSSGEDTDSDREDMDSANVHHRGHHEGETWMLLEFCDFGCLQVIILWPEMAGQFVPKSQRIRFWDQGNVWQCFDGILTSQTMFLDSI